MTIYLKESGGVLIPAQNISADILLEEGYNEFDESDYALYLTGAKTFVNGIFVDEPTETYIADQSALKKFNLQSQIDELDKKRIRAIAEPSLKDESTTWLEYYTDQILNLRSQISTL